jgi:hypothetical protein
MKILIDLKKAKLKDYIESIFGLYNSKEIIISKYSDIIVYELKTFFKFLIKKECNKILSELDFLDNVEIVFTDTVSDEIKSYFNAYKKVTFSQALTENLEKIIKFQKHISKLKNDLDITIFSNVWDENIFNIIDNIKDTINVISIVTNDDAFFNEISEYAFLKYGLSTNIKKPIEIKEKDFCIVLNTKEQDFYNKAKFTIDIYMDNKLINTNILIDFYSETSKKMNIYSVKNAFFVEKAENLLNIKWKIVKKS